MDTRKVLLAVTACALCSILLLPGDGSGQKRSTYVDNRGKRVDFPLGEMSFADEVISFSKGNPSSADKYCQPDQALAPPDYVHDNQDPPGYVTLGCGGTLVLRFVDNVLVDVDGPDLYVFEIGPDVEPTEVSISKDGKNWLEIGKVSGGTAEIDISSHIGSKDTFQYVRLRDLKSACGGGYPGADIDAVGAIGAGIQIILGASVLFDFNEHTLRPAAREALQEVAKKIEGYEGSRVVIDGHTDSVGSTEYNRRLSEARASAVRDYLLAMEGLGSVDMRINGYGEDRPVASNDTEEGRERNRRVEIVIIPRNNP